MTSQQEFDRVMADLTKSTDTGTGPVPTRSELVPTFDVSTLPRPTKCDVDDPRTEEIPIPDGSANREQPSSDDSYSEPAKSEYVIFDAGKVIGTVREDGDGFAIYACNSGAYQRILNWARSHDWSTGGGSETAVSFDDYARSHEVTRFDDRRPGQGHGYLITGGGRLYTLFSDDQAVAGNPPLTTAREVRSLALEPEATILTAHGLCRVSGSGKIVPEFLVFDPQEEEGSIIISLEHELA